MRAFSIKLCGIRRPEDVEMLNRTPPDYAGFVLAPGRRQVTPEQAAALRKKLRPSIRPVGVFVNAPERAVAECARQIGLFAVQLHGDEDENELRELRTLLPAGVEIWRAVRVRGPQSIRLACALPAERLVLDAFSPAAYGGTGRVADWAAVRRARAFLTRPFLLAGGLAADNLPEAAALAPEGFDVSSGVETDGCKDPEKIGRLMRVLDTLRR